MPDEIVDIETPWEQLELLDDLYENEDFLNADAIVVAYTVGDVTYLAPTVGYHATVRGTAEHALEIIRDSGETGDDNTCNICGCPLDYCADPVDENIEGETD